MGRIIGVILAVAGVLVGLAVVTVVGSMMNSLLRSGVLNDDFGVVVLVGVALLAFIPVVIAGALMLGGWALWRRKPDRGLGRTP